MFQRPYIHTQCLECSYLILPRLFRDHDCAEDRNYAALCGTRKPEGRVAEVLDCGNSCYRTGAAA